jgi:folate-binding protein YgfZ
VRVGLSLGRELDAHEVERLRIEALIPSIPADLGPGDLPNEGRLEADAISSTKGCYLGQEVVARIRSRGVARRLLFRVAGAGSPPAVPAGLWHAGAPAGQLRTVSPNPGADGFTGLAMLQTRLPKPLPELALCPGGGPEVRVLG